VLGRVLTILFRVFERGEVVDGGKERLFICNHEKKWECWVVED